MPDPALEIRALHQVALGSSNLSRSVAFYRDVLGLPLVARFESPDLAFFALGATRLLIEQAEAPEPGSAALYLEVDDLARSHEALASRGVVFDSPPHLIHRDDAGTFGAAGTEEWMAFFRDPDGNAIALTARYSEPQR